MLRPYISERKSYETSCIISRPIFCISRFGGLCRYEALDELKTEIESKLKEKGVQGYSLMIVAADQVKDEKVVGSCEGGSKKIIYSRGITKETGEKGQKE